MKRIAVQHGLEKIREGLQNRGYEVVDYEDRGHIDAIVYENMDSSIENVNNSTDGNIYGAILVNATNKTIDEIEYIIETRRYGRLFM
ncbi:MAG TPA: YkuS family protein [Oscillospiraceae bacterium]|nr:YkuS family protein [Oscillospiraceae bacterium]